MKTTGLLAFALVLVAVQSHAATITPASPTEQDVITASIAVPSSTIYGPSSTVVTGNVIRTDLPVIGFFPGPPVFISHEFADFGPLPQGTYTYQVFEVFSGQPFLLSQQTM